MNCASADAAARTGEGDELRLLARSDAAARALFLAQGALENGEADRLGQVIGDAEVEQLAIERQLVAAADGDDAGLRRAEFCDRRQRLGRVGAVVDVDDEQIGGRRFLDIALRRAEAAIEDDGVAPALRRREVARGLAGFDVGDAGQQTRAGGDFTVVDVIVHWRRPKSWNRRR